MSPLPCIYFGQCKASLTILSCAYAYPMAFSLTTVPLRRVKMGTCQQNPDFGPSEPKHAHLAPLSSVFDILKHHCLCSAISGTYFLCVC